jgi:TRAP-type transport system periplasmic protein
MRKSPFVKHIATIVALYGFSMPAVAAEIVLDIATAYPDSSFHVQNLKQFADDIAGSTKGSLKLRIHAGGSLLKAPEILQSVMSGKVAGGEVFGPSLSGLHSVFGLDATPFLATTYPKARKMWKAVERTVEECLAKEGLTLLMSVPWPPQGLFSARAINTPKEFEALAMRENSPPVKRLAELLGAKPVRIETPELSAASKDGRINLVFTSAAQGIDTKIYESLPYFYQVNAWLPRNILFVNTQTFLTLSKEHQLTLIKLAGRAEERGWAMSEKFAQSSTETLSRSSAKFSKLPPLVQTKIERAGNQIARDALRGEPALLGLMMDIIN